jgi:hypothetical protein
LIETGCNHSHTCVGHLHAEVYYRAIEELDFVYAYDLHPEPDVRSKLIRIADGHCIQAAIVARDDSLHIEAVIYGRLENLRALAGYFSAAYSANQLFALAAEHSAGDYFDPSAFRIYAIHLYPSSFN